jgi:molecular chaperone GrpE (heat shock protein)
MAARGPKSDKLWADAVRLAVNREGEDADGKIRKRLSIIADNLARLAMEGDMQAIKEVGDRLDGRPAQAVQHSGDGANGEIIFKTVYETK